MAIDYLGRDSGGTMDRGSTAAAMMQGTTKIVETKSPGLEATNKDLLAAVEKIADSVDKLMSKEKDGAKGWVKQVTDGFEDLKKGKKYDKTDGKKEIKYLSALAKSSSDLYKGSQSKNTIWFGVAKFDDKAVRQITNAIDASACCAAASRNTPRSRGGAAGTGAGSTITVPTSGADKGGGGTGMAGGADQAASWKAATTAAKSTVAVASILAGIVTVMGKQMVEAFDLDPFKWILKGWLADTNIMQERLAAIQHQQEGFNSLSKEAIDQYKIHVTDVSATGEQQYKIEEKWLKNLERGIILQEKDNKGIKIGLKEMKSVTMTSLNTAKVLGMETESVNEMFMDWHMHLALSANQLAGMGREMQNISRNTGVTGKEFEKVMQHTDKIRKTLQAAGLATAEALENVTRMMAAGQKHGIADEMQKITDALAGGFDKADEATKDMIMRATAAMKDSNMMLRITRGGGIAGDKNAMKKFFDYQDKQMRQVLKIGGLDEKLDLKEFNKVLQDLNEKAKTDPNAALKYGQMRDAAKAMGLPDIGTWQGFARAAEESQKTNWEKFQELQKKISGKQYKDLDELESLQKQKLEAQTNASMKAFTELQGVIGKDGTLDENAKKVLKEKLKDEMGEDAVSKFMKDIGGSAHDLMESFTERAKKSGLDINDMAKNLGHENAASLEQAIQKGGEEGKAALRDMNIIAQTIGTKEKAGKDPITDLRLTMIELGAKLRELTDKMLVLIKYLDKLTGGNLGKAIIAIAAIFAVTGALYFAIVALGSVAGAISTIAGFLSLGGAGAAGAGTIASFAGMALSAVVPIIIAAIIAAGIIAIIKNLHDDEKASKSALRDAQYEGGQLAETIEAKKRETSTSTPKETTKQLEERLALNLKTQAWVKRQKQAAIDQYDDAWWWQKMTNTRKKLRDTDVKTGDTSMEGLQDLESQIKKELEKRMKEDQGKPSLIDKDSPPLLPQSVIDKAKAKVKASQSAGNIPDKLGTKENPLFTHDSQLIAMLENVLANKNAGGMAFGDGGIGLFEGNPLFTHDSELMAMLIQAFANKNAEGGAAFGGVGMGLFDKDQGKEANSSVYEKVVSNIIENLIGNAMAGKTARTNKQTSADTSQALYYERAGSEAAGGQIARADYYNANGEVSSNSMDYTDQMKGEINTLGLSRANAATLLEKDRAGGDTTATALVPGIDEMNKTVGSQTAYLRDMVQLLQAIRDNSSIRSAYSNIIGAIGAGSPPVFGSGVSNKARDVVRGDWYQSFDDFAAGTVSEGGKGGFG